MINVGRLGGVRIAAGEEGVLGKGERSELGGIADDAHNELRVCSGNGTEGVRRLDDSVEVGISSLGGLADCDMKTTVNRLRDSTTTRNNARVAHRLRLRRRRASLATRLGCISTAAGQRWGSKMGRRLSLLKIQKKWNRAWRAQHTRTRLEREKKGQERI